MAAGNTADVGTIETGYQVTGVQSAITACIAVAVGAGVIMGSAHNGCCRIWRMACSCTFRDGCQCICRSLCQMVATVMGPVKVRIIIVTAGGTVTGITVTGGADGMQPGITVAVSAQSQPAVRGGVGMAVGAVGIAVVLNRDNIATVAVGTFRNNTQQCMVFILVAGAEG